MMHLSTDFVWRLCWTLIHSSWQILIVACIVGIALSLIPRKSARTRYSIACLGLVALYVTSIATFANMSPQMDLPIAMSSRLESPSTHSVSPTIQNPTAEATGPVSPKLATDSNAPAETSSSANTPLLGPSNMRQADGQFQHDQPSDGLSNRLAYWQQWLVIAWGVGVVLFGVFNVGGWIVVQRLKRRATLPVSSTIQSQLKSLSQRMGIRQSVEIAQSILVEVPVVIGFLRPVILLPTSILTGIPATQLDAILAHELAHIRRSDYLVNLLQTLTESLFFFHPAVWLISRQIRIEREFCCDDAAIAICDDQASYLKALATVESFRVSSAATPSYALSMDGGGTGLTLLRARRVLGRDKRKSFKGIVGMCSILLAMAIGVSMTTMRGEATMPIDPPTSGDTTSGDTTSGDTTSGDTTSGDTTLGDTTLGDKGQQPQPKQSAEKPAAQPKRNDVETKIDPEDFRLDIIYNGESNKPFYNYTFSTDMVKLERDFFWRLDQSVPQKDPKLKRVLSWLEGSRFFQNLDDPAGKENPAATKDFSSRYLMQVTSRGKVYREDLGWGVATLIRLNSLRSVLANGNPATPTQLDLLLGRISGFSRMWTEGWSDNGLKRRLTLKKVAITVGDPINTTLAIQNTGQQTLSYGRHAVSLSRYEIRVFDQFGRRVPYVGGSSQVQEFQETLTAGESGVIESFDLSSKNYLRRPGKYTVCYVGFGGERSNAVEFEMTPPAKDVDDGDLVGRLLPIVEGKWDLVTDMNSHGKLRPGHNYEEVVGRQIVLQHNPTGSIRDIALIWLWFADEEAQKRTDEYSKTFPPPGTYYGKIDRWHVYAYLQEKSRQRWPTIFADIKRALLAPENDEGEPTTHQGAADFEFHRDVPPAAAPITITVAGTATWNKQKQVLLDATITNHSKEAITTTLAHEWHGGEWPLTCLYGSVSPARAPRSSFAPIYLAGEDRNALRHFTIAPGAAKAVTLRMDWAGTGSVVGQPLIAEAGKYNAQLRLVFEQANQAQFVTGVNTTVELKPMVQLRATGEPEENSGQSDETANEPNSDDPAKTTLPKRETQQIGKAVIETYRYKGEVHASIHTATDEALAEIAKRNDIDVLRINSDSPHGGLRRIGDEEPPSGVTDDGLRHLAGMKNLRLLDLPMRGISDDGLQKLAGLKQLREVEIRDTNTTAAGIEKLQEALPKLKIIK